MPSFPCRMLVHSHSTTRRGCKSAARLAHRSQRFSGKGTLSVATTHVAAPLCQQSVCLLHGIVGQGALNAGGRGVRKRSGTLLAASSCACSCCRLAASSVWRSVSWFKDSNLELSSQKSTSHRHSGATSLQTQMTGMQLAPR